MIKIFKELRDIDQLVANLYTRNETIKKGKFGYYYTKFYKKNIQPTIDEKEEKLADARLENALTDEKTKEVLYTDITNTAYKFDKEGTKRLIQFNRALQKEYDAKEIEIVPVVSIEIPSELSDEEKEELRGLVI